MTLVRPFPAKIVRQEFATQVVCPMHDALAPDDRAELLATNPLSYLQVTRSVMDMPDASPEEIGIANAAGLDQLVAADVYHPLSQPAMYVYAMRFEDEEHTGIVAELDVAAFTDGRVLGHEAVQPDRVAALVRHFEAVPTRSELVTVLHRSDEIVNNLVAEITTTEPQLTVTDFTDVEHVVWKVSDPDAELIAQRLSTKRHYIADGHHRVAATVARWKDHGSPRGGAVLSVLYPDQQMHLLAFHRRVTGPIDHNRLLASLSNVVDLTEVTEPDVQPGTFTLRSNGHWHSLKVRDPSNESGVASLDVSALDSQILRPLLGVTSGDDRIRYVSERADISQEVDATDRDDGALFLLAAPRLEQLIDVAERGEVMPQKSTYIEPKPRAGIFLRPRQGPVDPKDLPTA